MFEMGQLEHLMTFEAKVTKIVDFGATPQGPRMDVHFGGDLSGEHITGKMEGIDYVRFQTSHEKYKWLCDTIIVGRGQAVASADDGPLDVDYYFERQP